MTTKLNIGIAGLGRMGTLHLEKFLMLPNVEVVGIFEANSDRSFEIETKYHCKSFESLTDLLFEVDGLVVATTTSTHYAIARKALESGVHVLIEKPMCESVEEAEELARLAREKKLVCQVGFLERFRLNAVLKDLNIGPVRFIEAHRMAPKMGRESLVDVVQDLMIHDLDLVLSMIGEEPSSISAIGAPIITPVFDIANVRLEFPSGAIANLTASRIAMNPQRKFRVFTLSRFCTMDFLNNSLDSFIQDETGNFVQDHCAVKGIDALLAQAQAFIKAMTGTESAVVSAEDGVNAIRISHQIHAKITERAAWKMPALSARKRHSVERDI